jgi:hypothetical protein
MLESRHIELATQLVVRESSLITRTPQPSSSWDTP